MEDINKLVQQLQEGKVYINRFGLCISAKVQKVFFADKDKITILFHDGCIDFILSKAKKVIAPLNIIKDLEWCYELINYYDDVIGYIGKERVKE